MLVVSFRDGVIDIVSALDFCVVDFPDQMNLAFTVAIVIIQISNGKVCRQITNLNALSDQAVMDFEEMFLQLNGRIRIDTTLNAMQEILFNGFCRQAP